LLFYLLRVLPVYQKAFADFRGALPARVEWQLELSDALSGHPVITFIGTTAILVLDGLIYARLRRGNRRSATRFWMIAPTALIALGLVVLFSWLYTPIYSAEEG
jgi:type II secretory pathway component PulF